MRPDFLNCFLNRLATAIAAMTLALSVVVAAQPVLAVQPDEILKDEKLEKRAREISAELRCLVCQNQSIDDSDAPLARDLRLLVRERLQKGESNRQVMDFIVSRYGEFVLLKPPFALNTLLLWLTPAFVLIGGVLLARSVMLAARPASDSKPGIVEKDLSEAEEARLKKILDDGAAG